MKQRMRRDYEKVAVGGTFDEFHKGHRALLTKAFEVGERVQIGLCSDEFVKKLGKPHITASYDERIEELKAFLLKNGLLKRAEIFALDDPFGITLSNGGIQALIVSKETEPTAQRINEKRKKSGMPPLHIVTIDMIPSENHSPISTTRIRRGEIDREGHLLKA
jgi:pantetheine-phosphate adenylyltransferase